MRVLRWYATNGRVFGMCGVVGLVRTGAAGPPVSASVLDALRDSMAARGPDGAGSWIDPSGRVGLGHRRLAIIDLSDAGAQPFLIDDGRIAVSFNGIVYNFAELRRELRDAGVAFRTDSDTEVFARLYDAHGMEMLHKIRGMFAILVWDDRRRTLFAARDAFGIKPLYMCRSPRGVAFASQVRTLARHTDIEPEVDVTALADFFTLGYVPGPRTIVRGIEAVPAGSWIRVSADSGKIEERRWFRFSDALQASSDPLASAPPLASRLAPAVAESVADHLVADVPVGLFLSSGIDSTTLLSHAARVSEHPIRAVTLGFDRLRGGAGDEVPLAERAARLHGSEHVVSWMDASAFAGVLEPFLDAMDQPTTDGLNSYLVSRVTVATGLKVALSGLGGDEMFAGYPSFTQIPRLVRTLGFLSRTPGLNRGVRRALAAFAGRLPSPKYASLLEYGTSVADAWLLRRGLFLPWELPSVLDIGETEATRHGEHLVERLRESVSGLGTRAAITTLETEWYMRDQLLRDTDWASMAHGLEVRVPLVDAPLLRTVVALGANGAPPTKRTLAETADPPLPIEIRDRRKTGFTVPVRDWLVGRDGVVGSGREIGLRPWARRVAREYLGRHGLDTGALSAMP